MSILEELHECRICPRNCGADRFSGKPGWCCTDASFNVSSIVIHKGEEPVIGGRKGICNLFFSHCNLQCVFCQNYQISRNTGGVTKRSMNLEEILGEITSILDSGIDALGFVSPSHVIPQMKVIIRALHELNYYPTIIYNSGGYDKTAVLRELEDIIDVYLPDFKYMDTALAKLYSRTEDYPVVAGNAIKEMYRQKGATLVCNNEGRADFGLVIRHLVLPGHVENSIDVLRFIAREISADIHISLMSQYYPAGNAFDYSDLCRNLRQDEYLKVLEEMHSLGFSKGWIQDLDSNYQYRPDFFRKSPFE
jgi:putative pyruvate formate lyase activating enzyme